MYFIDKFSLFIENIWCFIETALLLLQKINLKNLEKMKKINLIIITIVFLAFGSCIPSLHPLYKESDLITNNQLVGSFSEEGSLNSWVFYQNENKKSYTLRFMEKDNNNTDDATPGVLGVFEINIFKLNNETYMDFYPGENKELEQYINSLMELHLLPVHTFSKIEIAKDTIRIFQFDASRFGDLLYKGKIRIRHETRRNDMVLTASTEELQEFFIKYSKEKDVFVDPIVLLRNN